jgi:hypothetical protein
MLRAGEPAEWPWDRMGVKPIIRDGRVIGHEDVQLLSIEEIRRRYPDAEIPAEIVERLKP